MKKIILPITLIAGMSLTSCKKYYTCKCEIQYTGYYAMFGMTGNQTSTSPKMKKKEAETWCQNQEASSSDGQGNGVQYECTLQ